jgi:hypothetical protein
MPLPKVNFKKEEKTRGSTIPKVTKEEKNKKAYLLLLSLVTTGFSTPEPVNDISKVEAGDFEIRNKPYRASTTLPGFSIKDFFHEHMDILNGRRFGHVKFKDNREVEWYFKKLSEYDPPIIKPIIDIEWIKREQLEIGLPWPIEGERRYGIEDKRLHQWLQDWIILFGFTESILQYKWTYQKKPSNEEVQWHKFIYGKKYSNSFFSKTSQERSEMKKAGNYFFDGVDTGLTNSAIVSHYNN